MSGLLLFLTRLVTPLTWHNYKLVSLLWFVVRTLSTLEITQRTVIKKQHPNQWSRHSSHLLQIPFLPSLPYGL